MSFYSLWQHYISMTSQPLANSDRGVMRIVGIAELMRLPDCPRLSLTHYAVLYLPLSLSHLSMALTPSSSPPPLLLLPLLKLTLSLYFLFILSCLLLVPHLVVLDGHSLYQALKSSLIFPASVIAACPSDCAKTQECLYLSLCVSLHVPT